MKEALEARGIECPEEEAQERCLHSVFMAVASLAALVDVPVEICEDGKTRAFTINAKRRVASRVAELFSDEDGTGGGKEIANLLSVGGNAQHCGNALKVIY